MPTFLKFDDFNSAYEDISAYVRCECVFSTELVGGQPADEEGIRAFVIHHLKIADPVEQENAVQRILHDEVKETSGEGDEVPEHETYGLRVIRRDDHGPFLGDWMIKACLKGAASRLGLFVAKPGTKGSFAEAGRVRAWKYSLADPKFPNQIYIRHAANDAPANTEHKNFRGRVSSPKGSVSIMHDSEVAESGSRFAFEFRFLNDNLKEKLTEEDLRAVLGLAMIVGLGSARSLERGKFRIESAEIELAATKPRLRPVKEKKPKKGEKPEDTAAA